MIFLVIYTESTAKKVALWKRFEANRGNKLYKRTIRDNKDECKVESEPRLLTRRMMAGKYLRKMDVYGQVQKLTAGSIYH